MNKLYVWKTALKYLFLKSIFIKIYFLIISLEIFLSGKQSCLTLAVQLSVKEKRIQDSSILFFHPIIPSLVLSLHEWHCTDLNFG